MSGQPILMARSIILTIFSAKTSQGAAEDGKVLRKDTNLPSTNRPVTGYNSVSQVSPLTKIEVMSSMDGETIQFNKRSLVYQKRYSFTSAELSSFMLLGYRPRTGGLVRLFFELPADVRGVKRVNPVQPMEISIAYSMLRLPHSHPGLGKRDFNQSTIGSDNSAAALQRPLGGKGAPFERPDGNFSIRSG